MTHTEAKAAWYRERAGYRGWLISGCVAEQNEDAAYWCAREAAHWGRMALAVESGVCVCVCEKG